MIGYHSNISSPPAPRIGTELQHLENANTSLHAQCVSSLLDVCVGKKFVWPQQSKNIIKCSTQVRARPTVLGDSIGPKDSQVPTV